MIVISGRKSATEAHLFAEGAFLQSPAHGTYQLPDGRNIRMLVIISEHQHHLVRGLARDTMIWIDRETDPDPAIVHRLRTHFDNVFDLSEGFNVKRKTRR